MLWIWGMAPNLQCLMDKQQIYGKDIKSKPNAKTDSYKYKRI